MTDLRELLELGAGEPAPPAPMEEITRRGAVRIRRRRRAAAAGVVIIAAILAAFASTLPRYRASPARHGPPIVRTGILAPGLYQNPSMNPRITFTVPPEAVWRAARITRNELVLTVYARTTTGSGQATKAFGQVSLERWSSIYRPDTITSPSPVQDPVPADLIGWLSRHPGLTLGQPAASGTFAGWPAQRISVRPNPARPQASGPVLGCSKSSDCVLLARTSDGLVSLPAGDSALMIVPHGPVPGLVLTVLAPTNQFTAAVQAAEPLVNSLSSG